MFVAAYRRCVLAHAREPCFCVIFSVSYGILGLTNGDSLSSTNTSRTVKFAGMPVAKAWLVNSSDPCLLKAAFAGESYGEIGLPTGLVRRVISVPFGARIEIPELNGAACTT